MRIFSLFIFPFYGLLLLALSYSDNKSKFLPYVLNFFWGILTGVAVLSVEWLFLRRFELSSHFLGLWLGVFLDDYFFPLLGVVILWFTLWKKDLTNQENIDRLVPWTLGIFFLEILMDMVSMRSFVNSFDLFLEPITKISLVTLMVALTKSEPDGLRLIVIPALIGGALLGALCGTTWFFNLFIPSLLVGVLCLGGTHYYLYRQ
ncbi:hypothetical protein [Spirochaeta cellobiosiphila]|uniref:hypothetical protein n=1 Tax=Spirochaeta cellobiosiphila TaxID=504483 RepID=UPI000405B6C1|nr:hypothetical protein [Spirochaeta cellobiosiphila]